MKKQKITAYICICCIFAISAAFSGCSSNDPGSADSGSSAQTQEAASNSDNSISVTGIGEDMIDEENNLVTETRPIAEGDQYAIDKINPRSPEGSFPGDYVLSDYRQESQGKLFANGKSKIVIRAYNYKEDLQDLAIWADQACAIMKISNITSACDTVYSEPENITYMGFDTIKYNYEIIQYEFVSGADGQEEKQERGRYKGIAYYFYSDQDAYAIMFDTAEENWEEQSVAFEEFISDLEITETKY